MMARAAGVESIKSENIFFGAIKRSPISQSHGNDAAIIAASFSSYFKAEQIALLVAGVHFFHDHFYFIRRQLRRHNIVLVLKYVQHVVYRFRTVSTVKILDKYAVIETST